MLAALWKNDLRHFLIVLNLIAIVVIIIYVVNAVLSPRRARMEQERTPANQTPFLDDDDLESRRLERVLGWALLFAAVVAVALPLYWLREPTRQDQSKSYFDKNAASRGAVLYAKQGDPAYNGAVSKGCAQCHGSEGGGGGAPFRIEGKSVNWTAPPLNTELNRLQEDPECALPPEKRPSEAVCKVTEVITYGRPGTPMAGWAVQGGGPLNAQGVSDLVAFIRSIQLSPAATQAKVVEDVDKARAAPAQQVEAAQKSLTAADEALDTARSAVQEALALPNASDAQLTSRCETVASQVPTDPKQVTDQVKNEAEKCAAYTAAAKKQQEASAALAWAQEWQARRVNVSDGQLLFETQCARCHTQGWSVFNPASPPSAVNGVGILGPAGGGGGGVGNTATGGIGFNLRDGATERRFGTDESGGFARQVDFIKKGSLPNKAYGLNGLGSGKMPGYFFSEENGIYTLTEDQIKQIVRYERNCLAVTDYRTVSPACPTPPEPLVPPTTTTTVPKG